MISIYSQDLLLDLKFEEKFPWEMFVKVLMGFHLFGGFGQI